MWNQNERKGKVWSDLYRSVHHDLRRVGIVALGVSIGLGLKEEAHVPSPSYSWSYGCWVW